MIPNFGISGITNLRYSEIKNGPKKIFVANAMLMNNAWVVVCILGIMMDVFHFAGIIVQNGN